MINRVQIARNSAKKAVKTRNGLKRQLRAVIDCLNQRGRYAPLRRYRLDVKAAKKFGSDLSKIPSPKEYQAQAQRQAERLQAYVETWKGLRKSKRPKRELREKMTNEYPELDAAANHMAQYFNIGLMDIIFRDPGWSARQVIWSGPTPRHAVLPPPPDTPSYIDAQMTEATLFNILQLVCADYPKVTVDRCHHCELWYANLWGHQDKQYCRTKCAIYGSIMERRRQKIETARQCYLQFNRKKIEGDWRPYVSKKTGFDRRFLTRNRSEICARG